MTEVNACIFLLSSRTKCIKLCLQSCIKHIGNKYPIFVYHFDDIYNKKFVQDIHNTVSKNIHFIQIPYKVPDHIPESELFYNRTYLHYVKSGQFTKKRMGYLHMCYFASNFWNYPNTKFDDYEYALIINDDGGFLQDIDLSQMLNEMKQNNSEFASLNLTKPRKYGTHQGCIDTRQELCTFVKNYCKKYNVIPKHKWLKKMVDEDLGDKYFHDNLFNCDTNIYKLSLFQRDDVKHFVEEVNKFGGQYKYRWGDNEITTLIQELFIEHDVLNFRLVENGKYNPGLFGKIQSKAPNVHKL